MSNENNEEIELFDYMDEESESRKIPVNKKEKTGGKSGRSKKKKKNCRSLHRQRQRMRIIRQSKRWKSGLLRQAVR